MRASAAALLVQGIAGCSATWNKVVPLLDQHNTVVAVAASAHYALVARPLMTPASS
jgi:hypothetical protein